MPPRDSFNVGKLDSCLRRHISQGAGRVVCPIVRQKARGAGRPSFRDRWRLRWRALNQPRWWAIVPIGIAALGLAGVGFAATDSLRARDALFTARAHLSGARAALATTNITEAERLIGAGLKSTRLAHAASSGPVESVLSIIPVIGRQVRAQRSIAEAALEATGAVSQLIEGVRASPAIADPRTLMTSGQDMRPIYAAIRPALPSIERASALLARASRRARAIPTSGLIGPLATARGQLVTQLAEATHQVELVRDFGRAGGALLQPNRVTRILLLAQDTWELRPSGGFIGSYGILELRDGRLELIRYADATDLPRPRPAVKGPEPLGSALERTGVAFSLTETGWWPDFPTSARAAQAAFIRSGGERVDGVLAITQTFLEDLLRGLRASVRVPGYPDVITADNAAERILYHVELKQPRDTPRKRFLIELTGVLFDRFRHFGRAQSPVMFDALAGAFKARHAQIYFNDPVINRPFTSAGMDGAMVVPSSDTDFFSVADANLTASKANRWARKKILYRVYWKDGKPTVKVRILNTHNGPFVPVNPHFSSYVRVYARPDVTFTPDGDERFRVSAGSESGFKTFGTMQLIPNRQTVERSYTYQLPASVLGDGRYQLVVRPQAGAPNDTYEITIELGRTSVVKTFKGDAGDQRIAVTLPATRARVSLFRRIWQAL